MRNRLEGKVAIVTGGLSGIGDAIARRLLEEGARVVAADLSANTERLSGQEIDPIRTDVSDPEQVRDLSEYTDSVKKPAGIRHVLVGGTFALKDGAATGSRTGTVLKKV